MRQYLIYIFLISTLLFSFSGFARHDMADKLESEGYILTLEEILVIANQNFQGRIIEAELETRDGAYIYQVDLLDDDGVIWELEFDASNGQLITKQTN